MKFLTLFEGNFQSDEEEDASNERAMRYFAIGQDDEDVDDNYCWIYDPVANCIRTKKGGTHGYNFNHEVADRTFKGWYDTKKEQISVVFPQRELDKIGTDRPTVDHIPTNVYNKLRSTFGNRATLIPF